MLVADTGPLIAFARIGQFTLLRQVVGTLVIPDAVYDELVGRGRERPGAAEVRRGDWIHRHPVKNRVSITQLPTTLHRGERHAIALVGSLWVLADAKRRGVCTRIKPLVAAMLEAGYWLDASLLEPFFHEMDEHDG